MARTVMVTYWPPWAVSCQISICPEAWIAPVRVSPMLIGPPPGGRVGVGVGVGMGVPRLRRRP